MKLNFSFLTSLHDVGCDPFSSFNILFLIFLAVFCFFFIVVCCCFFNILTLQFWQKINFLNKNLFLNIILFSWYKEERNETEWIFLKCAIVLRTSTVRLQARINRINNETNKNHLFFTAACEPLRLPRPVTSLYVISLCCVLSFGNVNDSVNGHKNFSYFSNFWFVYLDYNKQEPPESIYRMGKSFLVCSFGGDWFVWMFFVSLIRGNLRFVYASESLRIVIALYADAVFHFDWFIDWSDRISNEL